MMWHKVSDREPPTEDSPWVVFLCPQWVCLVRYDAVKRGWYDRKGDYMFRHQCHPEVFWTLAPGQESGEPAAEVDPDFLVHDTGDRDMWERCARYWHGEAKRLHQGASLGEPDGETVEVRYAIAIGSEGVWSVVGWPGASDHELRVTALDSSDCGDLALVHYGTAPVPVPKPLEIRGEVKP